MCREGETTWQGRCTPQSNLALEVEGPTLRRRVPWMLVRSGHRSSPTVVPACHQSGRRSPIALRNSASDLVLRVGAHREERWIYQGHPGVMCAQEARRNWKRDIAWRGASSLCSPSGVTVDRTFSPPCRRGSLPVTSDRPRRRRKRIRGARVMQRRRRRSAAVEEEMGRSSCRGGGFAGVRRQVHECAIWFLTEMTLCPAALWPKYTSLHEGTNLDQSCDQLDWVSAFAPVRWRYVGSRVRSHGRWSWHKKAGPRRRLGLDPRSLHQEDNGGAWVDPVQRPCTRTGVPRPPKRPVHGASSCWNLGSNLTDADKTVRKHCQVPSGTALESALTTNT